MSMNFKDQWAVDDDGNKFVFTVDMQRRLSEAGLPIEPSQLSELPDNGSRAETRSKSNGRQEQKPKPREESIQPDAIQIDPQTGKYLGRLKWFDTVKGYGFIARGGGVDIFFHKTDTVVNPDGFTEGQWLLYDVEEGRKGPEATEVEPYEGELV